MRMHACMQSHRVEECATSCNPSATQVLYEEHLKQLKKAGSW